MPLSTLAVDVGRELSKELKLLDDRERGLADSVDIPFCLFQQCKKKSPGDIFGF